VEDELSKNALGRRFDENGQKILSTTHPPYHSVPIKSTNNSSNNNSTKYDTSVTLYWVVFIICYFNRSSNIEQQYNERCRTKQCKRRLFKPEESEFVRDAAVNCQITDKPSTQ